MHAVKSSQLSAVQHLITYCLSRSTLQGAKYLFFSGQGGAPKLIANILRYNMLTNISVYLVDSIFLNKSRLRYDYFLEMKAIDCSVDTQYNLSQQGKYKLGMCNTLSDSQQ